MNSSRMNRLEELGRVDAEKADTSKGKRNLKDEKSRIVRELKAKGGKAKPKPSKKSFEEKTGIRKSSEKRPSSKKFYKPFADGGRTGYKEGGKELSHRAAALRAMYGVRSNAQEGGLMDMGGMEKDYRQEGGFVPLGGEERADDVPARLSKNEFVFTADAVRGAGGGDIDKGAGIMENVMKNLEQGGQISEETQGLSGAQEMFGVSERLSEVV